MSAEFEVDELFSGLKALSESTFPKKCSYCGRVYESVEAFVKETENVHGKSGLKSSYDDDDTPIIELFRNCVCGSTLMDCFSERRDFSEKGLKRRDTFSRLMEILTERGLDAVIARRELLQIMKGGQSPIIEKYGVKLKKR